MNNDILFLKEIHLSSSSDVNEIQKCLGHFSISFNMNEYRFSSLNIYYQKFTLLQHHPKGEGISIIKLCRQLSTIPLFYSNLELLNNSSEINVGLGDFNLNALDRELLKQMSNTLSNFCLVISNSSRLNDSLIDQVYVRKIFLDTSHINALDFNTYFSD